MTIHDYLARIGLDAAPAPTREALRVLHVAHQRAVPFENLDVALGRPVSLEPEALLAKVVGRRRGGFCYELNGLFAWLLRELGFTVDLLSARVHGERGWGPPFNHLALAVMVEGDTLLADVGFGDSFAEPLPLAPGIEVVQGAWRYRLDPAPGGAELVLSRERDGQPPEAQYHVSPTPHDITAFGPMCAFHQASPQSPFTRRVICSRATADGRLTLAGRRLLSTTAAGREERALSGADELADVLASCFGLELDGNEAGLVWARIVSAPDQAPPSATARRS